MSTPEESLKKRHYKSSDLPTFDKKSTKDGERDLSKLLYGEVNANYRHLANVRFTILGLVPSVSLLAWVQIVEKVDPAEYKMAVLGAILGFIGTRITYGIWMYDQRNDELYDDLISRGRKIETEWSVHTGIFRGRRMAGKMDFLGLKINHGRALSTIYSSVLFGWGLLLLWYMANLSIFVINNIQQYF